MKNYSIDSDVRTKALILIIAVSLALTLLLNFALSSFGAWLSQEYPESNSVSNVFFIFGISMSFSPILLFGFVRWLFENHLWKLRFFKKLHRIPNLNGSWSGYCKSSFSDPETNNKYSASLEINQTFSKIRCRMTFASSSSYNLTTGLRINDDLGTVLEYAYQNQATGETAHDTTRDNQHIGFDQLFVDKNVLDGWYITYRNMMTKGHLHFELLSENCNRQAE